MSLETKAYLVRLPPLSEKQEKALENWAAENCWQSRILCEDSRQIWVALREKRRSQAAWARHVKELLAALGVRRPEHRSWLTLLTVEEAMDILRRRETIVASGERQGGPVGGAEDEKVIVLRARDDKSRSARTAAATFDIVRD